MQHRAGHAGAAKNVLGVLVHGDASFSGEGLVAETLQLSDLGAYTVGGMVHVVVNNQIGFTSSPHRMRSSQHPTDFAKVLGIPVLHVNADDINAVAAVATLACEWRQVWPAPIATMMCVLVSHVAPMVSSRTAHGKVYRHRFGWVSETRPQ